MFKLLDTVVLKRDVPDAGLRVGDLGAIVEVHDADHFEVEFVAASGHTQALAALSSDDVRHVNQYRSLLICSQLPSDVGSRARFMRAQSTNYS